MSSIKHILFDCDGVLVDTEYTAAIRMCSALAEHGVEVELDYYLRIHSGTTFSAILEEYFGSSMSLEDKMRVMNKVEDEVAESVKAVEGMPGLLDNLGIDKSVVSNSSIATVSHALATNNLTHHFNNRIFSSEQVPSAKPAPDLYLFAVASLQLAPEEILVVEDSRTGVQAAVYAGLKVVGFTGASHILPGHSEKLIEMGALDTASSAAMLSDKLSILLSKE